MTQHRGATENAGNPHVTKLANARAKALRYEKPQPTNRQPRAEVPAHPKLTEFFRGDAKVTVYSASFTGIAHARDFASKHGGYSQPRYGSSVPQGYNNSSEKTSAIWTPSGAGKNAHVKIEKTDDAYKRRLKQYEDDQRELKNLGPLLQGLSGGDGPAAKRVKTEEGL